VSLFGTLGKFGSLITGLLGEIGWVEIGLLTVPKNK